MSCVQEASPAEKRAADVASISNLTFECLVYGLTTMEQVQALIAKHEQECASATTIEGLPQMLLEGDRAGLEQYRALSVNELQALLFEELTKCHSPANDRRYVEMSEATIARGEPLPDGKRYLARRAALEQYQAYLLCW